MTIDLYNLAGRVRYADFMAALKDTLAKILARQGYRTDTIAVMHDPNRPNTASISVDRAANNTIRSIVLCMPVMDPDTQITGAVARDMLGFVMHELGHALWTNTRAQIANQGDIARQIGQAAGAMTGEEARQIAHKLQGVFEDYFIERKASADPSPIAQGAGSLLGSLNAEVMLGADEGAANPNPIQAAISYAMSQIDRHGRQGQRALLDLAKNGQDVVAPEVRQVVDGLLDQLDQMADGKTSHAQNVQRTTDRMGMILNAVQQLVKLPETPPQGDDGEGDEGGEGGDGTEGEGQGEGQGKPSTGGGTGKGKGGKSGQKPEAPTDKDQQLQDRISSAVPAPETQQEAYEAAYALTAESDGGGVGGDKREIARDPNARRNVRIAAEAANARRFADASRRALYSPDTVTVSRRLQTGRMDRRAITRAAAGSLDVFTRKRLDVGQRTAVVVMIDASGSMDNQVVVAGKPMTRLQAVNGTAAAIIPAIERAGGEAAVGVFGGDGAYELKAWNDRMISPERWIEAQGDLDTFGSTPMLEGMMWAERQLKTRTRATRKVCIWLCDGGPDHGRMMLARKIKTQAGGIEHVGIGIQCELDKNHGSGPLFPSDRTITVQDLSRLAPAFETVLFEMGQDTERRLARR